MTLLLTLEHGPRAQEVQQTSLERGELVIGRGAGADWQIEDPDMFVSRAHCTISGDEDGYFVTDTSSSGLFINDSVEPLGAGNTVRLGNGMRLRLGEYVLWVQMRSPGESDESSVPGSQPVRDARLDADDFFSARTQDRPEKAERPVGLPDPFDSPSARYVDDDGDKRERLSQAFDDPFSLDPVSTPKGADVHRRNGGTGPEHARRGTSQADLAKDWSLDGPERNVEEPARQARASQQGQQFEEELRAAFLRGLGFEPAEVETKDPIAEMERFGREYRLMMDGLMQLLRKRAQEKGNARVTQTIVGASDVNALKFLPSVDDALGVMLSARSPGFLPADAAIADAVRDLAEHHMRAWRGVQAALRSMIGHFDPAAIEAELEASSAVEKLLAGGRSAKAWELYKKRHREISRKAEMDFLGDVGADFRNAYEEE